MKGFTSTHRRCLHSPVTIGHVCWGFLHEDLVWRASASAVRSLFSMFWNHWTICWVSLGPAAFGRVFAGAAVQPWRQTLLTICLPPALVMRRGDGFYLICNNKKKWLKSFYVPPKWNEVILVQTKRGHKWRWSASVSLHSDFGGTRAITVPRPSLISPSSQFRLCCTDELYVILVSLT